MYYDVGFLKELSVWQFASLCTCSCSFPHYLTVITVYEDLIHQRVMWDFLLLVRMEPVFDLVQLYFMYELEYWVKRASDYWNASASPFEDIIHVLYFYLASHEDRAFVCLASMIALVLV